MSGNLDDLPKGFLQALEGKTPSTLKRTDFSLGDGDSLLEDEEEPAKEARPTPAAKAPAPKALDLSEVFEDELLQEGEDEEDLVDDEPPADEIPMSSELDKDTINFITQQTLEDPALAAVREVAEKNRLAARLEDRSRVSRAWLNALDQREFFLALAYPAEKLMSLLQNLCTVKELREWVNGESPMPVLIRRILTLENLLERRTAANRSRVASREAIETALRALPRNVQVSEILGGFGRMAAGTRAMPRTVEEIVDTLKVVRPGERGLSASKAQAFRPGASLPRNPRAEGKGRKLGEMLYKPSAYCYKISQRSVGPNGQRLLSPEDVMKLINSAAELEQKFNMLFTLRRKDTRMPWSPGNIELLPSDEVDAERKAQIEAAAALQANAQGGVYDD